MSFLSIAGLAADGTADQRAQDGTTERGCGSQFAIAAAAMAALVLPGPLGPGWLGYRSGQPSPRTGMPADRGGLEET
jgi:hypothetical protein